MWVATARSQIEVEWIGVVPVGFTLSAGLQGAVTDSAGVTYITGNGGVSSNTDTVTAAFGSDGTELWSHVFNGTEDWHDQARGITLGPGGFVWVCGNTPDSFNYANVLLLKYEAASGALLDTLQYSSGLFKSEHAASVTTDTQGNVTLGGGTVGDGADGLMLGFDPNGNLSWDGLYDGAAFGPFSQDHILQVLTDGKGDVLALVHGVAGSNQPDYVVIKYSGTTGARLWTSSWGSNGGDYPAAMALDAAGDVYVTGSAIEVIDKFGTIKLDGNDGQLIWQALDSFGLDDNAVALAVDNVGGVYITGQSDPDGDLSNFNDRILTVKRDAATGAKIWQHVYGASCVGCFDGAGDVAVDSTGNVLVVGSTSSPPYSADLILLVLDGATGEEINRGIVGSAPGESAGGSMLMFDAAENIYVAGSYSNGTTGQAAMAVFKFASLTSWVGLGSGLAGSGGQTPALTGTGGLTPGSVNQLRLSGALPSASSHLVVGLSRVDASFKGGVLVPAPDVIVSGLIVDGGGNFELPFVWPPGIPAGTPFYLQYWIPDASGPTGFAASNGLAAQAN